MLNPRLLLVILMAVAMWAYLNQTMKRDARERGSGTAELSQPDPVEPRILEEKTFASFRECAENAEAMVEELKDRGVSVALASHSPMVGSTVYMVYYPDSRGQISCRDGRLTNEILGER